MKIIEKCFLSIFLIFLLGCFNTALSQKYCFKLLNYNLLYYGKTNTFCDTACKDENLKYILSIAKPEIFAVNEIHNVGGLAVNGNKSADRLLNKVLNIDGVTHWKRAALFPGAFEPVINCLYYNSEKFVLLEQGFKKASTGLERLNVYKLYYKHPKLHETLDTTFLVITVVHLTAGSTAADVSDRATEAAELMDFLNTNYGDQKNHILTGDLNVNSSSEVAWVNLTTHPNLNIRFYDPIDRVGTWYNNASFADIHTQSTRTASETDGGVTGGCDDRYDFILCNNSVKLGLNKLGLRSDTYEAVGQDGTFFNKSVKAATITPAALADALYKVSDHLPVLVECCIDTMTVPFAYNINIMGLEGEWKEEQVFLSWKKPSIQSSESLKYALMVKKIQGDEWGNIVPIHPNCDSKVCSYSFDLSSSDLKATDRFLTKVCLLDDLGSPFSCSLPIELSKKSSFAYHSSPKLKVYPNPFENRISFTADTETVKNITISTIYGQNLFNIYEILPHQSITIDAFFLSQGVYLISYMLGKDRHSLKLIKN